MESLADALELLPEELHNRIIPGNRALMLCRTSKTMRRAVQNAKVHAHVNARDGVFFPDGLGLLENLNHLMAVCNVTVLDLGHCQLGSEGAGAMLEFLRRNTTLTALDISRNNMGDEGSPALAEALRLNTTLTSLNLGTNDMGDDAALLLAQALRINTTLTWLNLGGNEIHDGKALAETLRLNTALTKLDLLYNCLGGEQESALRQAWGDRGGSLLV